MSELETAIQELKALLEDFVWHQTDPGKSGEARAYDKDLNSVASVDLVQWISDRVCRVESSRNGKNPIKIATHIIKGEHPEAKGANFLLFSPLRLMGLVGSGSPESLEHIDVVGNAANRLRDFKFLFLPAPGGGKVFDLVVKRDITLARAIAADEYEGLRILDALSWLTVPIRTADFRMRQLYWLVDDDPRQDDHYHLLAPLFPTSLVHRVHLIINEDRFGEAAKVARQARREQRFSESGYHEYPNLAARKLGGTKPQNISQLNSERGGINYLLASLPPKWAVRDISPPLGIDSVFPRFGHRPAVRQQVWRLRRLLRADPSPNRQTRERRDAHVETLIDELVMWAAAHAELAPGWSASAECRLPDAECLWLDPYRDDEDFQARREQEDWPEAIVDRFANWLNHQLSADLPVGDVEYKAWKDMIDDKQDALREVLSHA